MSMYLTFSNELLHSLGGTIAVVDIPGDVMPPTKTTLARSGPGEHEFNHLGELILPPVAHGTPAQKRDAMMTKILEKRLWVHFARAGVVEVAVRGCINPRAKVMLSIGVLIDFEVPTVEEGGLKGVLDKYGKDLGEELARHLDMNATVVEFLKPRIDQVPNIQEMIAPYERRLKECPIASYLAPSMLSSRTPSSYGGSSSGSDGIITPAKVPGEVDIGPALSRILTKLEDPHYKITSEFLHP